jgi:RNA polymerase sigma-70 factor (ECF subfamily)
MANSAGGYEPLRKHPLLPRLSYVPRLLDFPAPRRYSDVHANNEHAEALLTFPAAVRARQPGADCAFEDLFAEHYPRLVRTLFRLVGNQAQAEELAADAFYKLCQQRPRQVPGENLAGWLYRTAMNLGLDALRANQRRIRREERAGEYAKEALMDETTRDSPLNDLLTQERRERVRNVIAQLKPVQGQVLLMGSSGFSCREIAAVLGLKPDSLYVLIARAKAQFEQRYIQLYGRTQ